VRVVVDQPGRAPAPERRLLARTPANVTRVRELQRSAGNRATRRLLRQVAAPAKPQPTVTPGKDANEIVVELPDKSRYRVTFTAAEGKSYTSDVPLEQFERRTIGERVPLLVNGGVARIDTAAAH